MEHLQLTYPGSPSVGDIVAVVDYANTADTNNLTVGRNGSQKIGGKLILQVLNTQGQSVNFSLCRWN